VAVRNARGTKEKIPEARLTGGMNEHAGVDQPKFRPIGGDSELEDSLRPQNRA